MKFRLPEKFRRVGLLPWWLIKQFIQTNHAKTVHSYKILNLIFYRSDQEMFFSNDKTKFVIGYSYINNENGKPSFQVAIILFLRLPAIKCLGYSVMWLSFPSFALTFSFTLQIQPQERETTPHHDTRVASGGLPPLMYKSHKNTKVF